MRNHTSWISIAHDAEGVKDYPVQTTYHILCHKDRGSSIDEHGQLLLLGFGLVQRVARCINKYVGSVLAHTDGVQGMGDLLNAELEWRLLRVPLGA